MHFNEKTFEEKFWPRIEMDPNGGCWLWTGGLDTGGYSVIQHQGRTRIGHRLSYENLIGPIPVGLQLDHKCRVRACVNPDHLEPVTAKENVRRSPIHVGSRKHCPKGHAYDAENTKISGSTGERICISCRREQSKTPEARARQASYREVNRERHRAYDRERYVPRGPGV